MWSTGLVVPQHEGSPRTRDQTRVPCTGRQIHNHCTTREVPRAHFFLTELQVSPNPALINYLSLGFPTSHPHSVICCECSLCFSLNLVISACTALDIPSLPFGSYLSYNIKFNVTFTWKLPSVPFSIVLLSDFIVSKHAYV